MDIELQVWKLFFEPNFDAGYGLIDILPTLYSILAPAENILLEEIVETKDFGFNNWCERKEREIDDKDIALTL